MLPGVLPVVDAHHREMRRLEAVATLIVRKAWKRIDPGNIAESWPPQVERILGAFTAVQVDAAARGGGYSQDTLRAQGIRSEPVGSFVPETFAGWASDGRLLSTLLETPAGVALDRLRAGAPTPVALDAGQISVERIARTQIADAGRVAASVDIAVRPNVGWTRMLNPPSCARCVVLAGRFYRWNAGFDRHPQDDCVHVATNAAAARREGLVDDPRDYFRSLSDTEQNRTFTKDGAQAIRDGADIGQVVNARRGMSTAGRDEFGQRVGRLARSSVFGQDVFTTLEGTTTRGIAGKRLISEGARLSGESAETVRRRSRGGDVNRTVTRQRVQVPRLMPESIYALATDRADAVRLLRRFGYIV
jgi:hypothetical protein